MYKSQNENTTQNDYKSILIRSLSSAFIGIIFSLIMLIILAAMLYFNPINEGIVSIIAIVCKYVCVIIVAFVSCINKRHSGYLRGAMSACVFIVLSGILYYSIYIDAFKFINLIYDLLIAGFLGLISGAVAVNINAKSK